jgi:hypothetical protein
MVSLGAGDDTNIPAAGRACGRHEENGSTRGFFAANKRCLHAAVHVAYSLWSNLPNSNIDDRIGGKVKAKTQHGMAAASLAMMCLGIAACGTSVSGHTYADNGGMVKIEFQSGGTARATQGPITATCTYTQSGNKVELTCEGVVTDLTVASDGSLDGPPDGMLSKLTKVN